MAELLTREGFRNRFGDWPLFGMVHLQALPGSPGHRSIGEVLDAARRDAAALQQGGVSAVMIENFGDRPFHKRVGAETVAAMSRVIGELARELSVPFGVNVLRNDGLAALAVAAATGASFIRVNVLVGAMLTDQGIIEGEAAEVMRERSRLCPEVLVFGDHMVKHATPLAPGDPIQLAKDLRLRGLADVLVVSGRETGSAIDLGRVRELRAAIDAPIIAGSGVNVGNASEIARVVDGAIVGTSIKERGEVDGAVDPARVRELVEKMADG